MSKPTQAGRSRNSGRRQSDIQDQMGRPVGALGRIDKVDLPEPGNRTGAASYARSTVAGWNTSWGAD
jgi:hypothetical protein